LGSIGAIDVFERGTRAGEPIVDGIPMLIVWALALVAVAHVILTRTQFGNWVFAAGGDAQAARYVGVPVNRVKILMFMFTAFCACVFATCQVVEFGSAGADRGLLKEFEAIIAVVIGGALLTGGYGSVIGAALGALIFGVVQRAVLCQGRIEPVPGVPRRHPALCGDPEHLRPPHQHGGTLMSAFDHNPIVEMKGIEKHLGPVIALSGVSYDVRPGECHCLLGDNGAGKSTFIKTMSGVHKPTRGEILFEGKPMSFASPRDAMEAGIATVYQDLAMIPLMSVTRNFWMGREPVRRVGPFNFIDFKHANEVTMEEMRKMGINLRSPDQAVGTLSGGERQTVAIARAVHFGAMVLILDEPTSALGVRQTANVLSTIDKVRKTGIGIVFITHNVRHAMAVGDRFTVLNRGKTLGTAQRGQITPEELQDLMAGGQEMVALEGSLGGTV
jgi:simple sugar transport system ATP-binding protein